MARRAADPSEGQSRNLAMRLSEQLADGLQRFRGYVASYGGVEPSTSDAVRDLLERGLSDSPLGFVRDREEILRDVLKAQQRSVPLRRELLTFLTDCAHDAYLLTNRSSQDATLLLNNLLAFKAVVELRRSATSNAPSDLDQYYLGNLSSADGELLDGLEETIARVREGATGGAEFLARNLHVALRDEPSSLPEDRLHQVLEPFLPGLLTLASKGFWYREKRPVELAEGLHAHLQQLFLPPASQHFKAGSFELSLIGSHESLPCLLDFGTRNLMLSLDYIKLCDLEALIAHPGDGDVFTMLRASIAGREHYFLQERIGGVRIGLSGLEITDLRELFSKLNTDPAIVRVRAVLDRRFGRV